MTTFLQKMGLSKTHKYESTLPLELMSVEQILNIDPKDVGFNIRGKEGVRELEHGEKSKALAFLLLIKENEQNHTWNKKDRETHIKEYLATEKKINNTRENNVNNLVENTQKDVTNDTNLYGRLTRLDPKFNKLHTQLKDLTLDKGKQAARESDKEFEDFLLLQEAEELQKAEELQDARKSDEDFEEFLLLQEAEAKNKESEELQDYFEDDKGGRRKSKRRKQRHSKSKKNKTKHIKHIKSKKNKSIKKLQKRKTRVMRNK
jgi:hypothetical protein